MFTLCAMGIHLNSSSPPQMDDNSSKAFQLGTLRLLHVTESSMDFVVQIGNNN